MNLACVAYCLDYKMPLGSVADQWVQKWNNIGGQGNFRCKTATLMAVKYNGSCETYLQYVNEEHLSSGQVTPLTPNVT